MACCRHVREPCLFCYLSGNGLELMIQYVHRLVECVSTQYVTYVMCQRTTFLSDGHFQLKKTIHCMGISSNIGPVRLGSLVRNHFSVRKFWTRLAAVSKCGKKVRTVAFHAVRSVNKSRDTRNWAQNKPEYAICVIFTTCSYYKALGLILCYLIWQIRHNFYCLDDGNCDVTAHRKMSVLGTAGAMVTNPWKFRNDVIV